MRLGREPHLRDSASREPEAPRDGVGEIRDVADVRLEVRVAL